MKQYNSKIIISVLLLALLFSSVDSLALLSKLRNEQQQGICFDANIISATVKNRLLVDTDLQDTVINVNSDQDIVQLTGKVHSWAQKQQAENIALGVEGVSKVNNLLELKHETKSHDQ